MSGASLFWYLLSSGGALTMFVAAAACLWIRPQSRAARALVVSVAIVYGMAGYYPVPRAFANLLGRGYHPLTPGDVPPGRAAVVLLASGNTTSEDWGSGRLATLDPIGAERTVEAARIFHLIQPAWLISSGGVVNPGVGVKTPGGRVMQEILIALGVPSNRIVIEDRSGNTRDEAVEVAAMLPNLHVDHVVVVTSEVHMKRSIGVFRSVGIDAIPGIAKDWRASERLPFVVPTEHGLRLSSLVAHEMIGLVYYWSRGWYR